MQQPGGTGDGKEGLLGSECPPTRQPKAGGLSPGWPVVLLVVWVCPSPAPAWQRGWGSRSWTTLSGISWGATVGGCTGCSSVLLCACGCQRRPRQQVSSFCLQNSRGGVCRSSCRPAFAVTADKRPRAHSQSRRASDHAWADVPVLSPLLALALGGSESQTPPAVPPRGVSYGRAGLRGAGNSLCNSEQ